MQRPQISTFIVPQGLEPFIDTALDVILVYYLAKSEHRQSPSSSLPKFEMAAERLEGLLMHRDLSWDERTALMSAMKECYLRLIAETGLRADLRANPYLNHGYVYYMLQNKSLDDKAAELGIEL